MFAAVNVSKDSLVKFIETLLDLGVRQLRLIINNFNSLVIASSS